MLELVDEYVTVVGAVLLVKILIVLVVIKLIVRYAGPALPAQIQPYVPVF